jgi:hypothetical protein
VQVRAIGAVGLGPLSDVALYVARDGGGDSMYARTSLIAGLAVSLTALLLACVFAVLFCRRRPKRFVPPPVDAWHVPRERVRLDRVLGHGAFGTVWQGILHLSDKGAYETYDGMHV